VNASLGEGLAPCLQKPKGQGYERLTTHMKRMDYQIWSSVQCGDPTYLMRFLGQYHPDLKGLLVHFQEAGRNFGFKYFLD
jgi:hypothetical protein